MERISRVIVEGNGAFKSERHLKNILTRVLTTSGKSGLKIKGFNATMARDRKRGKTANGKANGGHHARGGIARAKLLTPAERSAIASKAAKKRWKAYRVQHGQ
jgi:hypothetical protein